MLYLTGSETSLAKSPVAPQTDPSKSLGGYVSSTPVPNAATNALFDLISSETLRNKQKETIAIALVNKLDKAVTDVKLCFISEKEDEAKFKVAAVALSDDWAMESIANRYQEPISAEFHDATFNRASVDFEIKNPAVEGETIMFMPFGVEVEVKRGGMEGTWDAIEEEFSENDTYEVVRVAENRIRILRRDTTIVDPPVTCTYTTDGTLYGEFSGMFKNDVTNVVTLVEDGVELESGKGIGLWIQRNIKSSRYASNEKILEDYKHHVIPVTLETIGLNISYNVIQNK